MDDASCDSNYTEYCENGIAGTPYGIPFRYCRCSERREYWRSGKEKPKLLKRPMNAIGVLMEKSSIVIVYLKCVSIDRVAQSHLIELYVSTQFVKKSKIGNC